ncbi:MAG: glycosyltransferase 87 family protein, partial [Pseudomonadota bacterium]
MKALLRDPVFLLGLAIRLLLIAVATPVIHQIWFVPFLTHVTHAGTLVPWSSFLASGGPVEAFPYGLLYVLVYGPLTWIGELVAGPAGGAIGLSLTTLALDAGLYVALRRLSRPEEQALTGALYWLSPITLHVGYWHGQLDVFPVLLLTASLLFLRINRFRWSGYTLGLAIAAKASMVVALPFV